jgi:hypothetical protein
MAHTDHHLRGTGRQARALAAESRRPSHGRGLRRQRTRTTVVRAALRSEGLR